MSNTNPHHGEPTCPTPARLSLGESLAAPAMTGQGATRTPRNRDQWLSLAQFLGAFDFHAKQTPAVMDFSAINFGEGVAPYTTVPDGNHGDNFAEGVL